MRYYILFMSLLALTKLAFPMRNIDYSLWKAVGNGNYGEVKKALDKGADPTVSVKNGLPTLHKAILNGNEKIACYIIRKTNKDINTRKVGTLTTPLHLAASRGLENVVNELLQHKAQVDIVDADGNTPLHSAVNGRLDYVVVKLLIRYSVSVRAVNKWKKTPLHIAALYGATSIVEVLRKKASIWDVDANHETPIDYARKAGQWEVINLLTNRTGKHVQETPLHRAVRSHDVHSVVCILKNQKQAHNAQDSLQMTPLHWAAFLGFKDIVVWLLKYENEQTVNATDKCGRTALHWAAIGANKNIIMHLLMVGANPYCRDKKQRKPKDVAPVKLISLEAQDIAESVHVAQKGEVPTPSHDLTVGPHVVKNFPVVGMNGETVLHVAAANNDSEAIMYLKNRGDVGVPDYKGRTPLHVAAGYGSVEAIHALVAGSEHIIDVQAQKGDTALHMAALHGGYDAVNALLSYNTDSVNIKNEKGATPLYLAVYNADLHIIQLLLHVGQANPRITNKYGVSLLGLVAARGNDDVMQALLGMHAISVDSRDDRQQTPLHIAVVFGNNHLVRILLQHDAFGDAQDIKGETPLHKAAQCGSAAVIRMLIDDGKVRVNIPDCNGFTPLHVAAMHKQLAAIFHLITYYVDSIDVNARDNYERTPLHLAVNVRDYDTVDALIVEGCDPNAGDAYQETPLHYACRANKTDLAYLLCLSRASPMLSNGSGETPHDIAEHAGFSELGALLQYFHEMDIEEQLDGSLGEFDIQL